jgi:hypothetical protein
MLQAKRRNAAAKPQRSAGAWALACKRKMSYQHGRVGIGRDVIV